MTKAFNIDCMTAMAQMKDNEFDLAIVDPPYGIGDYSVGPVKDTRTGKVNVSMTDKYGKIEWNDSIPNAEYFEMIHRVAKNHIIFGFQFYHKYLWDDLKGVIIHDFKDNNFNMSHADVAITNLQKRTTVYRYLWNGFKKEYNNKLDKNRIHPAEKPNDLYRWLLKNYAKEGDRILDTHLGSGSSRIAAYDMGFDFVGYEIDKDYFEAQEKRFQNHIAQKNLFKPEEMY